MALQSYNVGSILPTFRASIRSFEHFSRMSFDRLFCICAFMLISVAHIDPESFTAQCQTLEVPLCTTAEQAATLAGFVVTRETSFAVFNAKCAPDTCLSEGDRLDIGTALLISPAKARELRAQKSDTPNARYTPRHGSQHQRITPDF